MFKKSDEETDVILIYSLFSVIYHIIWYVFVTLFPVHYNTYTKKFPNKGILI